MNISLSCDNRLMLSRCYYCIVLHLAISIALQLRPIARDTEKKGRCEKDEDATIERMVDQTGGGRIFCRELSTPEKIIYIEPSATDTGNKEVPTIRASKRAKRSGKGSRGIRSAI